MERWRIDRERVFGTTPEMVSRRLSYTLDHLEEERPMKKRSVPVLVLVILLVLAGVAYAAVSGGLKWYYENRFDYSGMLPQDMEQRIQTDIPQSGEGNPLANVIIANAAWLGKGLDIDNPDSETLDIYIRASVKDADTYEMVDGEAIDVDCARGEDERREHSEYGDRADEPWLWAYGTHGPLDKVMKDPQKQLLLFGRTNSNDIWIDGAKEAPLPLPSYDQVVEQETGEVGVLYSYHFSEQELTNLRTYADTEGYVTLAYQSWAAPFVDGASDTAAQIGITTFRIKLPEQ